MTVALSLLKSTLSSLPLRTVTLIGPSTFSVAAKISALEKQTRESADRVATLTEAISLGETQLKDTRASAAKRTAELEAALLALEKKANTSPSGRDRR